MSFDGLRVIAFESRRANEIAELIRRQQGDPFVAPSMREAPLENNAEAFEFAERLFRDEFDMMILLTGVGVKALSSTGTSRTEGATNASPPLFSIKTAISFARRDSKAITRIPASDIGVSILNRYVPGEAGYI